MPSVPFARLSRKYHRVGAIVIAVPLLVVLGSGLLLQLKKQSDWIQPPTRKGKGGAPTLSFDAILAAARTVPQAEIASWDDVDRLDVRPGKGVVKVRAKNRWEIQVDSRDGRVLQSAYRRSDLIESLHDGSFFGGDVMKLGVFLPSALVLLLLWGTGLHLFFLPGINRRRARKARGH